MKKCFLLLLTLSFLLFAGCEYQSSSTLAKSTYFSADVSMAKSSEQCTENSCDEGLLCHEATGYCTVNKPLPYPVSVRITPINNQNYIETQFVDITVNENHKLNLTMSEPLKIKGVISFKDIALPDTVPEEIQFQTEGDITGFFYTFSGQIRVKEQAYQYEVRVIPNRHYRVKITFSNYALPDYIENVYVSQSDETIDFTLPSVNDYFKLKGRVVYSDGKPAKLIKLAAISKESQNIYQTVTTDEEGNFTIILPPLKEKISFVTKGSNFLPVFPEFVLTDNLELEGSKNIGEFTIPKLPNVHQTKITVINKEGKPVSNTGIVLKSDINGGKIEFYTQTDTSGVFSVELFEGTYEFFAIPPAKSHSSIKRGKFKVGEGNSEIKIVLEDKELFQFEIKRDGTVFPGVSVFFTLQEYENKPFRYDRNYIFISNEEGMFTGLVEKGKYQVIAEPSMEQNMPGFTINGLTIDDPEKIITIKPPLPFLVYGKITDAYGNPVQNASVEFIKSSAQAGGNELSDLPASQKKLYLIIGEATTDYNGNYSILLPF